MNETGPRRGEERGAGATGGVGWVEEEVVVEEVEMAADGSNGRGGMGFVVV